MPSSSLVSHHLPMDHLLRGGGFLLCWHITTLYLWHAEECYQPVSQEKHKVICVANILWLQSNAKALVFVHVLISLSWSTPRLIYGNHTRETSVVSRHKEGGRMVK